MATKRRKVWVNFYGGEYGKSDTFRAAVYMRHGHAVSLGNGAETVGFQERLPGDVVLSREDRAEYARDAAEALKQAGYLYFSDVDRVADLLASHRLFRGGR